MYLIIKCCRSQVVMYVTLAELYDASIVPVGKVHASNARKK